jgi:hypothetical protein
MGVGRCLAYRATCYLTRERSQIDRLGDDEEQSPQQSREWCAVVVVVAAAVCV